MNCEPGLRSGRTPRSVSLLQFRHKRDISDFEIIQPLLCGTLLQYVRLRLQDASIAMVNGWGSILCGAHLYNAARQEGYLSTGWVDMEAFIAMHSPELIFVGKVPSSVDEYCKQLCFAQGMSITFYSHGPQRSKSISKKGPRHIDAESHVSRLLNNVHHSTTKAEFDAEAVSKMFTNVFEKNKRSAALNSLLTQWNKTHKLTNVQLLAIVRQTMANEQPMLHFDYIAMHHRCRQLFIKVRSDLDAELVCPKTEDHDTYEGSLSGLLTEILYLAGQKGNAGPLVKASGILKDVVEREGDAEMKKMRLKGKRHGWLAKGI